MMDGRLTKTAKSYNPVKWGDWVAQEMSEGNSEAISAAA